MTRIGALPRAVAHAAAVTIGDRVYVLGGTDAANAASPIIAEIDLRTRAIVVVGRTRAVADAAVSGPYLIGGTVNGHALADVREVRAR